MGTTENDFISTGRRIVTRVAIALAAYVFWWHVSFFVIFISRGDSIDFDLYLEYLRFMFGTGLEIPTFIQLFAVFLTVVSLIVLSAIRPRKHHSQS
ncbi:MAG: hypothetical protein LAO21_05185 [Acidobacteriia bacterium]|nr:hypothetical protein [Terriglobia bacterium]